MGKTVLSEPVKHSLVECLRELKFGRPAADQNFIDNMIRVQQFGGFKKYESTVSAAVEALAMDFSDTGKKWHTSTRRLYNAACRALYKKTWPVIAEK